MKTIYISDDGKIFEDEFECKDYEWRLKHPLTDICFYDKDNNVLTDIFSEETYSLTERVVITSESTLKDLQEFADYTGYCCYYDIDECGEWVFDYKKETFVKVGD